jgi:hypothetical protein
METTKLKRCKTRSLLHLNISQELHTILEYKADMLGIPTQQFIKYILIKEASSNNLPISISERVKQKNEETMKRFYRTSMIDDINDIIKKRKIVL